MEKIKAAVIAVCAVSAARCVICNIVSASKLKEQVAMIMNILLAIVLLAPFAEGISGFSLPDLGNYEMPLPDELQDRYSDALIYQTSENVSAVLAQQLESSGISFEKIETEVNISADYSIFISSVTVTTDDFEAAEELIKNSLGMETEVINGAC